MQSPVDQMNHTSQDVILVIKTQMDCFLISGKIQKSEPTDLIKVLITQAVQISTSIPSRKTKSVFIEQ